MENMETYYLQYSDNTKSDTGNYTGTDIYYPGGNYPWDYYHPTVFSYPHYSPNPENKIERSFEILKVLVKEKLIKEPDSYSRFVKLVEKIAGAI